MGDLKTLTIQSIFQNLSVKEQVQLMKSLQNQTILKPANVVITSKYGGDKGQIIIEYLVLNKLDFARQILCTPHLYETDTLLQYIIKDEYYDDEESLIELSNRLTDEWMLDKSVLKDIKEECVLGNDCYWKDGKSYDLFKIHQLEAYKDYELVLPLLIMRFWNNPEELFTILTNGHFEGMLFITVFVNEHDSKPTPLLKSFMENGDYDCIETLKWKKDTYPLTEHLNLCVVPGNHIDKALDECYTIEYNKDNVEHEMWYCTVDYPNDVCWIIYGMLCQLDLYNSEDHD